MDHLLLEGGTNRLLLEGSGVDTLLLEQTVAGADVLYQNDLSAIEQGQVAQTAARLGGVLIE